MPARERARARRALRRGAARACCPTGAEIFDAHLHLGHDIDGMVGDYDQLEELMARYGISRAFMFCLDEPDRHPGFRAANDRTLAFAERSNGRLIPFVRLDLNESPIEEARALPRRRRARHQAAPARAAVRRRATSGSRPVFALAAEQRVPILIHGGRGLPPIADGPARARRPLPGGDADHRARRHRRPRRRSPRCMAGRKGVLFDTSTWSPVDLLDFYRQVPPEQVVYASDYPYGQQPASLLIALKTAQRRRLRRRPAARDARPARRTRSPTGCRCPSRRRRSASETFAQPLQLARIHQYLSMATPLLWMRQPDTVGVLGLAINACAERNGHVGGGRPDPRAARRRARPLGDAARRSRTRSTSAPRRGSTFRLIHLADIEAVTAGA